MKSIALQTFAKQVELFSYVEQLSAMEIILSAMKKNQTKEKRKVTLQELDELSSKGGKCLSEDIDAQDYVNSMREDREF